uniref:hypothetical protein n=1 Tax=Pedobacter schmidteae TaxID=2201271 RepID=UPI000EACA574|nr:hypothetical protein [Pedobacter schmidteae]
MKHIISNISKLGVFITLLTGLLACNKEKELTKAISIQIGGYNSGDAELEMSIDTLVYRNKKTQPNMPVDFANVYTYSSGKGQATLRIKDLKSGREVFQQQLNLGGSELELFFPFVLINGKALEIKPPAADPTTNKIGFYIHYPASNDAIDIFLQNNAGENAYIAKNVQPSGWVYSNYLPSEGFTDASKNYFLCFTKAGTTDSWAFEDSEGKSKYSYSRVGTALPMKEDKGLVRTYFVTPAAADLRVERLFKLPK